MPVIKYRVAVTDSAAIAKVFGTLTKVVQKSGGTIKRVVHDYAVGQFFNGVAGDPPPTNKDRWELTLKLPTGGAAAHVEAYIIQVVVLDRFDKVIDGFIRRRAKP